MLTSAFPGPRCGLAFVSSHAAASVRGLLVTDTTRLAYELSRSSLQDQAARLSDLRTRAGTLLAAASIAGSFLGVTNGTIDTLGVLALIAYLASVGTAVYILSPHELTTEFRGSVLLETAREVGATDDEAYETAMLWLEKIRAGNVDKVDALSKWYVASAVALGAEVLLWTVALTA